MELASQLSIVSVGIGIVMVIYGLIKYFKQRAQQKRHRDQKPENGQ